MECEVAGSNPPILLTTPDHCAAQAAVDPPGCFDATVRARVWIRVRFRVRVRLGVGMALVRTFVLRHYG